MLLEIGAVNEKERIQFQKTMDNKKINISVAW